MIVKSSREKLVDAICDYYNRQANGLDRNITIEQFYPMWIEQKAQYAAPTTINRDKKNWKKFYEGDAIVRKPIRELTKIELETWVLAKAGRGKMNKHQFSHLTTILNQVLDYAVEKKSSKKNLQH